MGTDLQVASVTVSQVTCSGTSGGSVTISGTLDSTGASTWTDVFLVTDNAQGQQLSAPQIAEIQPTDWTHGGGRLKTVGFSYTVSLNNGNNFLQVCFAQPGSIGRFSKCICTDILTVPVSCQPTGPTQCLMRTRGFWGNHPSITAQFLPQTVCGVAINTTTAGTCHSSSEALCTSLGNANEWGGNPQAGQLIAQLMTAELNVAASLANGGDCGSDINTLIAKCTKLCYASGADIGASGCIDDLDAFNNSASTITPPPFDNPGPASSKQCQAAHDDGVVVSQSCP
jgi:hypothetical protein